MKVHMHTRFCLLCVVTFLFQQCSHCHGDGHRHHDHAHDHDHDHAHSHDHNDLQISQAPYTQAGGAEEPLGSAESEQRFFIQQLFHRYGQRDRLDFGGFQNLLLSLGLGEVKVVGLEHEDLGHDHVAHLDLLEVQEGRHSHSPDHPSHAHPHPHPHPHPERGEEQDFSVCKETAVGGTAHPSAAPASDGDIGEHHDHNHDDDHDHGTKNDAERKEKQARHRRKRPHAHRQHKHNTTRSQSAGSQGGEGTELTQSGLGEDAGQSGQLEQSGQPDSTAQLEQLGSAELPESPDHKPKRTRRPLRNKGPRNKQGGSSALSPSPSAPRDYGNVGTDAQDQDGSKKPPNGHPELPQEHDHEHEHGNGHAQDRNHEHTDGHAHVHRREAPESLGDSAPAPAISSNHHKDLEHQHEECLNLTQLLHHYGLSADSLISPTTFTYLCPALLYQIDSRVCIRHYHQVDIAHPATEPSNSALIWVWGFLSITVISLLSLLGVVLVPILNQSCFKFLLTFLVALAVGTLSGDALLHLLPHSQGEHDHSHDTNHSNPTADLLEDFDGVWKGLTALAGIYLLFIIEHCIGMFKHYRDQGGSWCRRRRKGDQAVIGRKLSDHKLNRRSDAEWLHLKPLTTDGADSSMLSCDSKHNTTQLSELPDPDSPCKEPLTPSGPEGNGARAQSSAADNGRKAKTKRFGHSHSHGHSHGHAHQGHCHSDQEMKDAGVASIAWMVIMGDGMHNFSDGLAIGAAFSANVTGGISTSVAVFCHELPHELGDFAVLLKAGMSVKQAIVYNVLSALMAYVGMLIGTAVGQYTHNVTSWIFAVTAGMFLYVALVDMLPEMLHGDSEDHKRCQFGHFLLQNLGMLTGFAIMLLIAIFEDRIVLDFGF